MAQRTSQGVKDGGSALPSGTAQPALPCAEALGRCNPDQRAPSPALAKEDVLYATRPANLAPEWYNYRLDGVQTDFFRPKLLGSSIIEGENVGMPLTQASCISCHAVSSVRSDGFEGINLLTTNPVGFPQPLPSKAWIRRDFVWSLGLACPNGPHNSMQAGSLQPDCVSTLP
jgi:hypothetical protein